MAQSLGRTACPIGYSLTYTAVLRPPVAVAVATAQCVYMGPWSGLPLVNGMTGGVM